jgi:glycosyltransferase involved in cell wall biosynthesis
MREEKTLLGRLFTTSVLFSDVVSAPLENHTETMKKPAKILQIGNYPPPMCGWAMQLKLVTDELRQRGHVCEVLKINEGRQVPSPEYVDVQNGPDYLKKIWLYALRGYRLNVHVNGMSKKGYGLALAAVLVGRLVNRPTLVTFHGGLSQDHFPRHDSSLAHLAFYTLFQLAGAVACDSETIQDAIVRYGIEPAKVQAIATFSPQYLQFTSVPLPEAVEKFLKSHTHVCLSYVSFRPEYRLELLREGMKLHRRQYPGAGFIWLGFPDKELPAATEFVHDWPADERDSLLLLGNLTHDQFLTLMSRSFLYLRTPACDGVAASVLESLALAVPVVASENGRRPAGVVTFRDNEATDMAERLGFVLEHFSEIKSGLRVEAGDDNVGRMADWLVGDSAVDASEKVFATR